MLKSLVLGGLVVGTLDIMRPIVGNLWRGAAVSRVFQSVASGALGRGAYSGGLHTAAIGVLIHYSIAIVVVAGYFLASRRLGMLVRQPVIWGPVYGVAVYGFMQFVVFPLSAIGRVPHPFGTLVDGLLTHIILVGLPTAFIIARLERVLDA